MKFKEPPLVTLALLAYNQSAYVRFAVEAALSQDYSPLEIILSDDASSDETPEIITELAAAYSGPHRVIVNINKSNLGIGRHVNNLFHAAKGELIVMAGGDDISNRDRVRKTVDLWVKDDKQFSAIFCAATGIDSDGNIIHPVNQIISRDKRDPIFLVSRIHRDQLTVMGACAAYTPQVLTAFGELDNDLSIEDTPLAVRASLLGGIGFVHEPLLQYRHNVSVWTPIRSEDDSFAYHRQRLAHLVKARLEALIQVNKDVTKTNDTLIIKLSTARLRSHQFIIHCLQTGRFSLSEYIRCSIRAHEWTGPLLRGLIFAFPRFHKYIFFTRRIIRRTLMMSIFKHPVSDAVASKHK